ncbi:MAG: Nucleotidyl transferase [Bryobacterales bacterium]|nr:Nucleotidyl transferase [Bryobacterales bacterium]
MWGIIPAAGVGSRIQPLAFSKELLPVGSRSENGTQRPRAVSEYLVERMIRGGATRLCFVISADKCDLVQYFGNSIGGVHICYVVQPRPAGLCDALFQAMHLIDAREQVLVGLPDTVWFPEDGFAALPNDELSFLLFDVERPELFDAVLTDGAGEVREIRVKSVDPQTSWVWGGFKLSGVILRELYELWQRRSPRDEYLGTLVNAYLAEGGAARGVGRGEEYVDVGTLNGYWNAIRMLENRNRAVDETSGPELAWSRSG